MLIKVIKRNQRGCPKSHFMTFWTPSLKKTSGQQDLNLRPHGPQPCALPSYAIPRNQQMLLYQNFSKNQHFFENFLDWCRSTTGRCRRSALVKSSPEHWIWRRLPEKQKKSVFPVFLLTFCMLSDMVNYTSNEPYK